MMTQATCDTPVEGIMLDDAGKCPCGKELKDCCHKDAAIKSVHNEALDELCMPQEGTDSPCGDEKLAA